jgi:hypothetical protein
MLIEFLAAFIEIHPELVLFTCLRLICINSHFISYLRYHRIRASAATGTAAGACEAEPVLIAAALATRRASLNRFFRSPRFFFMASTTS